MAFISCHCISENFAIYHLDFGEPPDTLHCKRKDSSLVISPCPTSGSLVERAGYRPLYRRAALL